jgi:hypothetical protein
MSLNEYLRWYSCSSHNELKKYFFVNEIQQRDLSEHIVFVYPHQIPYEVVQC